MAERIDAIYYKLNMLKLAAFFIVLIMFSVAQAQDFEDDYSDPEPPPMDDPGFVPPPPPEDSYEEPPPPPPVEQGDYEAPPPEASPDFSRPSNLGGFSPSSSGDVEFRKTGKRLKIRPQ